MMRNRAGSQTNSENQDRQQPQSLFKTLEAPDYFNCAPLLVRKMQGIYLMHIYLFIYKL